MVLHRPDRVEPCGAGATPDQIHELTIHELTYGQRFVDAIERFVKTEGVDMVTFKKGERKDDIAQQYLATFTGDEGVLFVGKAQEKAKVLLPSKEEGRRRKTRSRGR